MVDTVDNAENASVESGEAKEVNYEAEASKMGWRPQEQFKGSPEKWVDAQTFVERGEQILPIVKAELKKTRAELAEVRTAAQEFYKLTEEAATRRDAEWRAKYEQAVQDKAAAITSGDGEKAVEAEARQKELEANRPQPKKEEQKLHPSFVAWRERNDWFGSDEDRTDEATAIGFRLTRKGLQGEAFFEALDEEMAKRTPPRASPQRGGKPSGESKGVKSYDNLKPEYKEACDKMVRTLGIKKEQYIASCDGDAFRS
jgi:hypothetical protein